MLVALLGQLPAEVLDVRLVAVRVGHLPERVGQDQPGPVQKAEVVGEMGVKASSTPPRRDGGAAAEAAAPQ